MARPLPWNFQNLGCKGPLIVPEIFIMDKILRSHFKTIPHYADNVVIFLFSKYLLSRTISTLARTSSSVVLT